MGSEELTKSIHRYCLWVEDDQVEEAKSNEFISTRFEAVRLNRLQSNASSTKDFAKRPHRFVQIAGFAKKHSIVIPKVSTENRTYLPIGLVGADTIISDLAFGIYDEDIWNMSILMSKIHRAWIVTVCGKMRSHHRYSNTLGWNTFPLPKLTETNKLDLTKCAKDILLAREMHFPATIAELYKPEDMPENLRTAHDRNDEVLERIYIGRRFKNDTERLEKLFELYTKMTTTPTARERTS